MSAELTPIDRSPLEPAVFEPVAKADTDSWVRVVADVIRFSEIIADTDFVPKGLRGSSPATAAAILYGREIGLPPMTALSQTHVVDGRPAISAEAMRALVFAAGHEITIDESSGSTCTMRGRRRGSNSWTGVSWTLAMARSAGLLDKKGDSWRRYPRAMLVARATVELCRLVFPDVIHGFRAVEEIDEAGESSVTAATVEEAQSGTAKPVRRRRRPAPAPTAENRPAAPAPVRPVDPHEIEIPLPGEDGYETQAPEPDPSSGVRTAPDGNAATRSGEPGNGSGEQSRTDNSPDPAPDEYEGADNADADDRPPVAPRQVTRAQGRMLHALFGDLDIDDRDDRLSITSTIVGREITTSNDLTLDEATGLIDTLSRMKTIVDVEALLDHIREAEQPRLPLFGDDGEDGKP